MATFVDVDSNSSTAAEPLSQMAVTLPTLSISPSGGISSYSSIACSPLSASSTDQPSSSSASFTAERIRSSSSTARMRVPTPP